MLCDKARILHVHACMQERCPGMVTRGFMDVRSEKGFRHGAGWLSERLTTYQFAVTENGAINPRVNRLFATFHCSLGCAERGTRDSDAWLDAGGCRCAMAMPMTDAVCLRTATPTGYDKNMLQILTSLNMSFFYGTSGASPSGSTCYSQLTVYPV